MVNAFRCRIKIPPTSSVCLFIRFGHDIRLGVVFTDTHFQHIIGSLDYTNIIRILCTAFVTHSGDITDASTQDGMCEFIDITLHHEAQSHTVADWQKAGLYTEIPIGPLRDYVYSFI